jgi:hypothetical protein
LFQCSDQVAPARQPLREHWGDIASTTPAQ